MAYFTASSFTEAFVGISSVNVLCVVFYCACDVLNGAISTRLPEILDWTFGWELRTPSLREEGVRGGTVQNSVGKFL